MLWHVIEGTDDHHVASLDHGHHENIQTIDPTIQARTSTPGGVRRSTQRTPIPKYALGNKKTPASKAEGLDKQHGKLLYLLLYLDTGGGSVS